jgi:hypothetical protein
VPTIYKKQRVLAIGLELGGRTESTGLCVVQSIRPREHDSKFNCPIELQSFHVRHLHRFPPGTTITAIVQGVKEAWAAAETPRSLEREEIAPGLFRQFENHIRLIINGTAVGAPIIDKIRRDLGSYVWPVDVVTIGGAGQASAHYGGIQISKLDMLDGIYALLEDDSLKIASGLAETQSLIQELIDYRNRPRSTTSLNSEAGRELPSDDLIFALGIANWILHNLPILELDI